MSFIKETAPGERKHNASRKGTVFMDVVYQLVFVLHIYQLTKMCRAYFGLYHAEENQGQASEAKEVRIDCTRLLTLFAYTASVSLLWPMLPEVLGCDANMNRFFLLNGIESPPYLMVSFNVLSISLLIIAVWFLVWLVKSTRNLLSK